MVERSRSAEGGVVLFQGENFGEGEEEEKMPCGVK